MRYKSTEAELNYKRYQSEYKKRQRVFRCYFDREKERDEIAWIEAQGDNFVRKVVDEAYKNRQKLK